MGNFKWDQAGKREYQTGTDRGVLYSLNNNNGTISYGIDAQVAGSFAVAWNGLTAVTQSPSGAESNPIYADNIKYLDLLSAEEFGFSITAYTYPDKFGECDGSATLTPGVTIKQQKRKKFGFSYRSLLGNDVDGTDFGYEIHCIYGAQAGVSERAHTTVNDSPEAVELSWECTTTPVEVGEIAGTKYKPTACVTINSTDFTTDAQKAKLAAFENMLYDEDTAKLPLPSEIYTFFTTPQVNNNNNNNENPANPVEG